VEKNCSRNFVNGGAFQNIKADFPVYANDISIDREVQSAFLQASKQVLTPFLETLPFIRTILF